jgi:hypothetical protein
MIQIVWQFNSSNSLTNAMPRQIDMESGEIWEETAWLSLSWVIDCWEQSHCLVCWHFCDLQRALHSSVSTSECWTAQVYRNKFTRARTLFETRGGESYAPTPWCYDSRIGARQYLIAETPELSGPIWSTEVLPEAGQCIHFLAVCLVLRVASFLIECDFLVFCSVAWTTLSSSELSNLIRPGSGLSHRNLAPAVAVRKLPKLYASIQLIIQLRSFWNDQFVDKSRTDGSSAIQTRIPISLFHALSFIFILIPCLDNKDPLVCR